MAHKKKIVRLLREFTEPKLISIILIIEPCQAEEVEDHAAVEDADVEDADVEDADVKGVVDEVDFAVS